MHVRFPYINVRVISMNVLLLRVSLLSAVGRVYGRVLMQDD